MNMRILIVILCIIFMYTSGFAASTTYVYDELDRVQEITLENGQRITYEYDKIGNIIGKMPSGNVVTISANAFNGTIYPHGTIAITMGGSKTFTIAPYTGDHIVNVYVDGVAQGAITSYTFSNLNSSHTITATFGYDSTCSNLPARIIRSTPLYFQSIQEAYNSASDGDIVQAQSQIVTDNLLVNRDIALSLNGGFNCDYSSKSGITTLQGGITYGNNANVSLNDIEIKYQCLTPSCTNSSIRIATTPPMYFSALQQAFDVAVSNATIQTISGTLNDTLLINKDIPITVDGGYDADFLTSSAATTLQGGVTYANINNINFKNIDAKYQCVTSDCGSAIVNIVDNHYPLYFATLQQAYDVAVSGSSIKVKAGTIAGNSTIGRDVVVTLTGGYDDNYSVTNGTTTLLGIAYSNGINITASKIDTKYQ